MAIHSVMRRLSCKKESDLSFSGEKKTSTAFFPNRRTRRNTIRLPNVMAKRQSNVPSTAPNA